MKLLVVDDDENIRELIKIQLKHFFCTCIMAAGLTDALKRMDEDTPDLVLLDVFLRDGDGLQVLTHIREKSGLPHLPVIIMTGNPKREVVNQALQLGVAGFLTKPFLHETLIARIDSVVKLRKKPQQQIISEDEATPSKPAHPLDQPRTILLLDPNTSRNETIHSLLHTTAWEVITCDTLHTVSEKIQETKADYLFVNINMNEEGLDATELLQQLNSMEHAPGIVALSPSGDTDALLRARESGITDFILDPVTYTKLEKAAESLMGRT